MIKARHTLIGKIVCDFYSGFVLSRAYKIKYISEDIITDMPILLISNHFSWWDGFIQYNLNKQNWNRNFHVMMLEEHLSRNMILNKAGAFSVRKNSRDILKSLHYCFSLLEDKNNLVLLFPQGKIQSLYTTQFSFEKGLAYILKNFRNDFQLIFNINMIDYLANKKPSLTIYCKKYGNRSEINSRQVEADFNAYFLECKKKQEEA